MKSRDELLVEVREDLSKSEETLLADVYDEIINRKDNNKHAAKRFAALLGKSAIESAKAATENLKLQSEVAALNIRLYWLTIAVSILTVVATAAGCIQAYYSYASYTQDSRSIAEQAAKEKAALSLPLSKSTK